MKDYVIELVSKETGLNAKMNAMREYLQAYALKIMHDEGVFRTTAFLGGTALRFLYNLPRFSEDLYFSLTNKNEKAYQFAGLMAKLKQEFILAGYNLSVTYNDEKTVQSAFIKFDHLLFEAGISPHRKQKFSIKIEIDTNPPEGAGFETDIVNKYFPISFLSYDLPSLLAGKIHALMSRKYTKGRDFFDLGWYLSRWKDLKPNIPLLLNALKQSGWTGDLPTEENWKTFLYRVVEQTDWKNVKQDVENFLQDPKDMEVFSKENLMTLLSRE
jgi:predicted nucleotidyltransferase component of viral defense system